MTEEKKINTNNELSDCEMKKVSGGGYRRKREKTRFMEGDTVHYVLGERIGIGTVTSKIKEGDGWYYYVDTAGQYLPEKSLWECLGGED